MDHCDGCLIRCCTARNSNGSCIEVFVDVVGWVATGAIFANHCDARAALAHLPPDGNEYRVYERLKE